MFHSYSLELNNSYSVLAGMNDTSVLTLGSLETVASTLQLPVALNPPEGIVVSVRTNS